RRMASETGGRPLESADPRFLYLYGRAQLLSGNYEEAVKALEQAIAKSGPGASAESVPVDVEARLALAAAALKYDKVGPRVRAYNNLDQVIKKNESASPQSRPASEGAASEPVSTGTGTP
ncbi:MAG TPA: tetratricopeptide repeat protein, partial [Pyrinomonadaceae bacterium]|nr:tetratricopeptide repeat protein [Pyrinomonadaceae bacterium]